MNNKGSAMIYTIIILLIITMISGVTFTSISQKVIRKTKEIERNEKELAMEIIMQGFMYNFLHESMGNFSINGFDVEMQKDLLWEVRYKENLVYTIQGRSEFFEYYIDISNLIDTKITYYYKVVGALPKLVGKWKSDI